MDGIYCGPPPLPAQLWTSWNFDPPLIAALLVLAVAVRHERAGLLALGALVLAFVSPLCALSSALFSARVVHHVLLVAIAAPLLASAWPGRRPGSPALPFAVSAVTLWAWHIPAAYDLALANVAVYWVMQITLLASAVWFWRAVLADIGSPVDRLFFIVAGFAQMGMLGAILTFAPGALYAAHAVAPFSWGLTPLQDQQLGGLLMWVPAGIPYAVAAILVARRSWSRLAGAAT
ncbi:putative membrane protein [Palleronia marisminoris]|uniref:Cytochrome c oxidase caa3 assembly factor (Caa3_CtaG) n=1 Tax=Palleronia marisminoris TaxID=315423 RepID=A0A1Y5S9H1_9RHOB|nr:cytochrome c oxidase assembly protein [Palleronia marisminoris]SFG66496.1 putative membrane protein [Palleronia marisminoris]SLN34062.1 Cytochrome c oxidase caa3 assembly factor (Caa3_CtaG) [Palleronia marisminoris]